MVTFPSKQSGSSDFSIDLNGQTIFVNGTVNMASKGTLTGSGCVIATGDVTFQLNTDSDMDDFIFVMSLTGSPTFQPGGTFYGSVAAQDTVYLHHGILEHEVPPGP